MALPRALGRGGTPSCRDIRESKPPPLLRVGSGEEVMTMAHKKTTGPKAASAAGKVLANPKSTKTEKSAAASALSQTHKSKKK